MRTVHNFRLTEEEAKIVGVELNPEPLFLDGRFDRLNGPFPTGVKTFEIELGEATLEENILLSHELCKAEGTRKGFENTTYTEVIHCPTLHPDNWPMQSDDPAFMKKQWHFN